MTHSLEARVTFQDSRAYNMFATGRKAAGSSQSSDKLCQWQAVCRLHSAVIPYQKVKVQGRSKKSLGPF